MKTTNSLRVRASRFFSDPSPGTLEPSIESISPVNYNARTYSALLQRIHNDLRIQHPEWIQPDGECPTCDSYEARLMELLDASRSMEFKDNIALPHRELSPRQ
jgi:hypothetical protein